MSLMRFLRCTTALVGSLALLTNSTLTLAQSLPIGGQLVQDSWNVWEDAVQQKLPLAAKIALLRSKVKYVFVIFHENESFDHFFGTYPGANGLFSAPQGAVPANATSGFKQKYLDTSLNTQIISPFLMPQAVTTTGGQTRADLSRRLDFGRSQPPGHGERPACRPVDWHRGERPLRDGSRGADNRRVRQHRHET